MFENSTTWMRRAFGAAAVGGALALAVAGTPAGAQTSSSGRQFVTGSVTSVHGASVQVSDQTQNTESTVTLSSTTQVTKRQSADASAITAGTCVRVIGTGSASKGITARTVALSPATSSGCAGDGAGGPGGQGRPRFGNGPRPNFPDGTNGNRRFPNGGNRADFAIANGPVVSVAGDKMVVKSTTFVRPASSTAKTKSKGSSKSTSSKSSMPKTTTANVTVTLASSTTYSETVAATTADVTVGSCVTATGATAGAGITADRVNVSAPVNGACTGGFGRGGFGGGGSGGNGSNGQV